MKELTSEKSPVGRRIETFTSWYRANSELKYALRLVQRDLFDIVLGWAATHDPDFNEQANADKQRQLIDTFLVGASLFRYPSILGDPFRRKALIEALKAGARSDDFPLEAILQAVRPLKGRQGRSIQRIDAEESKVQVANDSGPLLNALIQRIQLDLEPHEQFDWDHIFPRSHETRMQVMGQHGRKVHHKHRGLINAAGNLWALDYSINRSLKAAVGQTKFDTLDDWRIAPTEKFRVLDEDQVSVTEGEKAKFIQVDALLSGGTEDVNRAMDTFRELVRSRMQRLLDDAIKRFPGIEMFASSPDIETMDESNERHVFAAALALTNPNANLRGMPQREARRLIRDRQSNLLPQIEAALAPGLSVQRRSWSGLNSDSVGWTAIHLDKGNCCEIITRWTPESGARMFFKAYPKAGKASDLYDDFDHIALGASWDSTDAEVVEAFRRRTCDVEERYPGRH